ncbi:CcdB family protein [Roseomonas sp. CCTCC AB2023176]|uniref:CcdB family protein n=1 Tax=Roseomonas sp. CCTCC AB2023176 TaxID=3342640 RepID=UPI0035DCE806
MSQFAVHRNPGRDAATPFVVQMQSSRLADVPGRFVMPLVRVGPRSPPDHALTPRMTVLGETVYANPFDVATVPKERLGTTLALLDDAQGDAVVRALDELISRA